MAWDKDQPAGSLQVRQVDDAIRTNNTALETAVDAEHDFTTGGTQTGQHHFVTDTTANMTAALAGSVEGRLYFATDVRTGELVAYVKESGAWMVVSAPQDVPRKDEKNDWSAGAQYGSRIALTPTPGTPDTLAWALDDANFFTVTLVGDTIISNPTVGVSITTADIGHWLLQITMDGTGGHTVTFDTNFLPANGAQPAVDTAANSITLIHITKLAKAAPNLVYRVERCA